MPVTSEYVTSHVLVTFLITVMKYLTEQFKKEERFTLAYGFLKFSPCGREDMVEQGSSHQDGQEAQQEKCL
jgi:hypothetical protein